MTHLANASKISKFLEKTIVSGLKDLYAHLLEGQLGRYESLLDELLQSAFNYISELVLPQIAIQLQPALVDQGRELGGRKLELRRLKICLSSGQEVEVQSPYVRQLPKDKPWSGSRHMLARHWHVVGKASPGLYSKVGYCSALGPSYELAHQTLKVFGIDKSTSGVRDLTNHLSEFCYDYGEDQCKRPVNPILHGPSELQILAANKSKLG